MLFYEHGYIHDTLDGTIEKAVPELINQAQALGINIKGLDGTDWRNANLLRLKSFYDINVKTAQGYLSIFESSFDCRLESIRLSEYLRGFDSMPKLNTNVTIILDNTIRYSDFRPYFLSETYRLDLTELDLVNASIVFNSALKRNSLGVLSECDTAIIGEYIKVQDDRLRLLSLYSYLLNYIKRGIHYERQPWHANYRTDVLPLFKRHINAVLCTDLSTLNLRSLNTSNSADFIRSIIRSQRMPESIMNLAYLALGYESAFGFIPDNLRNVVNNLLYEAGTQKRGNK